MSITTMLSSAKRRMSLVRATIAARAVETIGDIVNWDITELKLNGQNGWGHYTIYSRSSFFPFSSLNSHKPTAGDGNGDNVEILLFFFCFPFFVAFSSNPFFSSSSAEDAGYKITPADGSALRGSCVVARDATYDCTSALTNDHGQLLFRCTSDLTGLHAR